MHFGPLIKFYRTQKGMTQKELANGICSVPHLSKIESNAKEANHETISLLLEKVGVNPCAISDNEEQIAGLIAELNEKIDYFLIEEAEEALKRLKAFEGIIPFTTYLYTYELSKFRYFISKGMIEESEKQYDLLKKHKKIFSQPQTSLFHYLYAVLLSKKGAYKKADEILSKISKDSQIGISCGELLYHKAIVKTLLEEHGYALHYGKMALQQFMDEFNFKKILHVLMLLGINYTHSKIYDEAQETFNHLIRNAEILEDTIILPEVYHNMGYLQKRLHNYKESVVFFEKSKSLQEKNTINYLITLYTLGEIHFELKNFEIAKEIFKEVSHLSKQLDIRKFKILSNYYLMALDSPEKSLAYSESKVIPYLEENDGKSEELIWFYKMLSNHYRTIGRFDQAVKYIEKIN